jgi:two-component system, cell cycle sensor histidine kinase and response regulator CckA
MTDAHRKTILVVEDEELLRELLVIILEENGYDVLSARDGIEAYEMYVRNKDIIVIVLSDLGLPRLGGWEAFRKMKEFNPSIKAILASGYFDPELKEKIIASGAKHFVQKPYNPVDILATIRSLIDED